MFRYGATALQTEHLVPHHRRLQRRGRNDECLRQRTSSTMGRSSAPSPARQQNSGVSCQHRAASPPVASTSTDGSTTSVSTTGRSPPREISTDMNTPLGSGAPSDPTPADRVDQLTGRGRSGQRHRHRDRLMRADNVGVAGVQFFVDGVSPRGRRTLTTPYALQLGHPDRRPTVHTPSPLEPVTRPGTSARSSARDRQRREHQHLPERSPCYRPQSSDGDEVLARRAVAHRGVGGQDP